MPRKSSEIIIYRLVHFVMHSTKYWQIPGEKRRTLTLSEPLVLIDEAEKLKLIAALDELDDVVGAVDYLLEFISKRWRAIKFDNKDDGIARAQKNLGDARNQGSRRQSTEAAEQR